MSDFKKLKVWQKAHALALAIDRIAGAARDHSSLRSQLVRAAMSIDANIAEGRALRNDREQIRYMKIAIRSSYEVEAHLIMGRDVHMLSASDFGVLMDQDVEVRKMLFGLVRYLKNGTDKGGTDKGGTDKGGTE